MKGIFHEEILLPASRQRKSHDPDAHQELITSIQTTGLLHPIVVREDGDKTFLVAGERRLRAMREIFELGGHFYHDQNLFTPEKGGVPTISLGELAPLDAMEAELEENIRRVDLSWQERVDAETRLFDLRGAQAKAKGLLPPHVNTVAKEVFGTSENHAGQALQRDIVLSRNMHRPEVKGAKSASEAYKALARVEETERNQEVAKALGKEFLGSKHTLINQDCLAWAAAYAGEPFDVVCMDPPYGMGADEFGDAGGGAEGAHFYEDGDEIFHKVVIPALALLDSLTKADAHAYIFCDIDRFPILRTIMEGKWRVFRTPMMWFKPTAFRAPWPTQGPQRKYEVILYAVKGDLKCTKVAGDVLTHQPDENLGHQAQKPVALITDLLSRSVRPGMRVLDMFCGTGPIFPAAHALSAIATGIEMDGAAFAIAAGRITKLKEGT